MAWSIKEYNAKLKRVQQLLESKGLDYVLLTSQTSIEWLTGGRSYINQTSEKACADLLVGRDAAYLVSNNIEVNRLLNEEIMGLGIEAVAYNWWDEHGLDTALSSIAANHRMVAEAQLGSELSQLRWHLLPEEQERYRELGAAVGSILEKAAFAVQPGMSEQEIAQKLRQEAIAAGINPGNTLVGADDRVYQYRHLLPTEKKLERYLLLSTTWQKHGLYVSATRLVHFGPLPDDLRRRHQAVQMVDAQFIGSTVPDASVAQIFTQAMQTYQRVGYPDEWKNHHQGGMIGYASREFRASEHTPVKVCPAQAYAWNPTIAGVKSEDTILLADSQAEIISQSPNFPVTEVEYSGGVMARPAILIR